MENDSLFKNILDHFFTSLLDMILLFGELSKIQNKVKRNNGKPSLIFTFSHYFYSFSWNFTCLYL